MIFGKNVNRYYLKYWYLYLLGIVALFFVDYYGNVKTPLVVKEIIDGLSKNSSKPLDYDGITSLCFKLAIYALINFIGRFLWRIGFFTVGQNVGGDLRHRMFKNSLTLSQAFYSDNKVGGLMSYYINDIGSIRESFGWGTMMLFDTLFLVPMVLYQMFKLSVVVTICAIIPLLILLVGAAIMGKYMEEKYKDRQDAFERLSDYSQESFSAIRVVKAFVREAKELHDFNKKNKENENVNIKYLRLSVLFDCSLDLFIWATFFVVIFIGSYYAVKKPDDITVGTVVTLVEFFDTLIWPMFAVGEMINIRSKGKASLKRVDILLDAKTDLIDSENPVSIDNFKGNFKFNHLSFKYPDSKDIYALNDCTFEIKSGEFIGIIGKTGSSKSTLASLLLRLYNVDRGQILIDGNDIMDYKISDLRSKIGYVPQDNFLYSSTIEKNIAFSSDVVDRDTVISKAKVAGVHNDIMEFNDNYETKLGERGVSVSGGQKQRISIARALYKDPEVLILDDSLSAVDTNTESEILKFLKEERKGKTTILIAHRISSIIDADKILVLDAGGVVSGFDTHKNLLETNKIYKDTYNLQKLEQEGGISNV